MPIFHRPAVLMASAALAGLAACSDSGLDFDMRGNFGDTLDTAEAARQPVAAAPQPCWSPCQRPQPPSAPTGL